MPVHGTHNAVENTRNEKILIYVNGGLFPRNVSAGFRMYTQKPIQFPKYLEHLLAECQPCYQQLGALAIQA